MKKFFVFTLALLGAGMCSAEAAAMKNLSSNRLNDGIQMSFAPSGAKGNSNAYSFYIDSDNDVETGLKINGIGADFRFRAGALDCYVGDGKTQEWTPAEDLSISAVERGGRYSFSIQGRDVNPGGNTPVKVAVFVDSKPFKVISIKREKLGSLEAPVKVIQGRQEYFEEAGDAPANSLLDFVKCYVQKSPDRANTVEFGFTNAENIPTAAQRTYRLRLLLKIGDVKDGASVNGEKFNYMIENRNLLRHIGVNGRWEWQKIGRVRVAFTKKWCEMDLPLRLFKEKPEKIAFRFSFDNKQFIPAQKYKAPEFKINF